MYNETTIDRESFMNIFDCPVLVWLFKYHIVEKNDILCFCAFFTCGEF